MVPAEVKVDGMDNTYANVRQTDTKDSEVTVNDATADSRPLVAKVKPLIPMKSKNGERKESEKERGNEEPRQKRRQVEQEVKSNEGKKKDEQNKSRSKDEPIRQETEEGEKNQVEEERVYGNINEGAKVTNPVKVERFAEHVRHMQSSDDFRAEFKVTFIIQLNRHISSALSRIISQSLPIWGHYSGFRDWV